MASAQGSPSPWEALPEHITKRELGALLSLSTGLREVGKLNGHAFQEEVADTKAPGWAVQDTVPSATGRWLRGGEQRREWH